MTHSVVFTELLSGGGLIALEFTRSVPAWLRIRRSRSTAGISAISTGVLAGSSLGWITVAVLAHSPAAAVATVVWLVFHLLLWREVALLKPEIVRRIAVAAMVSLSTLGLFAIMGMLLDNMQESLGIAIGIATAAYSLSALVTGKTSRTTSGLSVISLAVNSFEGVIYLLAGVGYGGIAPVGPVILGYVIFGSAALLSNGPRLCRTCWRRVRRIDGERLNTQRAAPRPGVESVVGFLPTKSEQAQREGSLLVLNASRVSVPTIMMKPCLA